MVDRRLAKCGAFFERGSESAVASGLRDVAGAWLCCSIVAAISLAVLAVAAPPRGAGPEALIGTGSAATVAIAEVDHTKPHRERRC